MDVSIDVVDAVLALLALLSLVIWTIAIAKFISYYNNSRNDQQFRYGFDRARHLNDIPKLIESTDGNLSRICTAGMEELHGLQHNHSDLGAQEQREMLLHAMLQQAHAEQTRMEKGLGILASVGSTAPFIGLFGTVWGIMHALKNISVTGSAGLDVVAGPIGEALIATAFGIATAVPAVLAYNYFLRRVRLSNGVMDDFAFAFYHLAVKSGLKGS
jgi:biopolymer transport protein ExbB